MHVLVETALSNALMAIPLALLAFAVGRWSRRPALEHALWVLVLIKLVTPPLYRVHLSVPEPASQAAFEGEGLDVDQSAKARSADVNWGTLVATFPSLADDTQSKPARSPVDERHAIATTQPTHERWPASEFGEESSTDQPTVDPRSVAGNYFSEPVTQPLERFGQGTLGVWWGRFPRLAPIQKLVWVWITGGVLLLLRDLRAIVRFQKLVHHADPDAGNLQATVDDLAKRFGLSPPPAVVLVPGVVSPMIWPLGHRAKLLMPRALLSHLEEGQVQTLLAHELAHLRRRDHWVRLLELFVAAIYWWHPIVWWSRRRMRGLEEEACDAWVTWAHPSHTQTYANALLNTLDFLADTRPTLPPVASGVGQMNLLKRRLAMIMNGPKPKSLSMVGWMAIALGALVLLPWTPTLARDEDKPTREVETEVEIEIHDDRERDHDRPSVEHLLSRIGQLLVDGRIDEAQNLAQQVRHRKRQAIEKTTDRRLQRRGDRRQEQLNEERENRRRDEDRGGHHADDDREPNYVSDWRQQEAPESYRRQLARAKKEGRRIEGYEAEVRRDLAEKIRLGLQEFQDEFQHAAEEIRKEVLERLEELPAELVDELEDFDLEEVIEQTAGEMPHGWNAFLDAVDIDHALENALEDLEFAAREDVSEEQAAVFRREWNQNLRKNLQHLQDAIQAAIEDVRKNISDTVREAPRDIMRALEDMDVTEFVDEVLEGAPHSVQAFFHEVDLEGAIQRALDSLVEAAGSPPQGRTRGRRSDKTTRSRQAIEHAQRLHEEAMLDAQRAAERTARELNEAQNLQRNRSRAEPRLVDRRNQSSDVERRLSRLESRLDALLEELVKVRSRLQDEDRQEEVEVEIHLDELHDLDDE